MNKNYVSLLAITLSLAIAADFAFAAIPSIVMAQSISSLPSLTENHNLNSPQATVVASPQNPGYARAPGMGDLRRFEARQEGIPITGAAESSLARPAGLGDLLWLDAQPYDYLKVGMGDLRRVEFLQAREAALSPGQ